MTQPLSTICNEIDFKLRLIAHFKKVYDKNVGKDAPIQRLMLDQTVRTDRELFNMVNTSNPKTTKKLRQFADKTIKKLGIGPFIEYSIEETA